MLINSQFNFTHSFFYDHDLAQMWLDDFNHNEDDKQVVYFGDNDYVVIFANETIMNTPYYKVSHLRKMNKQQVYDLLEQVEGSLAQSHFIYEATKQDFIDELIELTNYDSYNNHFDQVSWCDLESDFIIHGYCQGDAKAIKLVSDKNNQFEYDIDSLHLENLYFNSPIFASVEIYNLSDDRDCLVEQISFNEYLDDSYNIDKDNLIKVIDEHFNDKEYYQALKFYMENNFPQYPNS